MPLFLFFEGIILIWRSKSRRAPKRMGQGNSLPFPAKPLHIMAFSILCVLGWIGVYAMAARVYQSSLLEHLKSGSSIAAPLVLLASAAVTVQICLADTAKTAPRQAWFDEMLLVSNRAC